jgi:crotonobetainyl-CoA:carnitine CoA-transferase CaiB-like acyl-CoA transferase
MVAPLEGITVLELANWVAAPSCAALMADMGADVIKVEPLTGDGMRGKLRQPTLPEGATATDFPFHLDNRGKRSVAIDLADDRGSELVRDMAATVDVFITNLLPGRLDRYGLAPASLHALNRALVYGIVSGYGTEGPDADRIAFDLTAFFARGGIMSLIGDPDQPPPAFRAGQGDHVTALCLLAGILAALRVRDLTGEGHVVKTALMQAGAWTIGCDMAAALVDRKQPSKRSRDQAISPMNTRYQCGDGVWVNLSAHNQGAWPRFCTALGRPDLAEDERYDTPAKRFQAGAELVQAIDEIFRSEPFDHWASRLDDAGILWGRVADLPDVIDDPQARALGMFAEIEHPEAGRFETLAAPFRIEGADVAVRGPAPECGEHTADVLAQFGVTSERVAALTESGVLGGRT